MGLVCCASVSSLKNGTLRNKFLKSSLTLDVYFRISEPYFDRMSAGILKRLEMVGELLYHLFLNYVAF